MSATASDPWFYADWLSDPCVRSCSRAARSLWMDLLCLMGESTEKGKLLIGGKKPSIEQLARVLGDPVEEVQKLYTELVDNSVGSFDRRGVFYCRRMIRDVKKRAASQKGGKIGGRVSRDKQKGIFSTPNTAQEATPPATPPPKARASSSSHSSREESENLTSARTEPRADQKFENGGGKTGKTQNGHKPRKRYTPGTTTISSRDERIARFEADLAGHIAGGWTTVIKAKNRSDPDHEWAMKCTNIALKFMHKHLPHDWPPADWSP